MTEHEDFEGLAAGYALHALEPQDEQRLAVHLLTCQSCARLVADTAALGAAFAGFLEPEPPPAGLRERILAAAVAEPRAAIPLPADSATGPAAERSARPTAAPVAPRRPDDKVHHRLRMRRMQVRGRVAVGVLAAAVGIGVAVPVTLAVSDGGKASNPNTALAQLLLEPHAREVTLRGPSPAALARAVLTDNGVYLLADGLPVNDRTRSIYVLWAAKTPGAPAAVATFDVRNGSPVQLTATKLPFKRVDISQMAISYEPGRKAPDRPSDVVLSGSA
jgi:hypothetical protein